MVKNDLPAQSRTWEVESIMRPRPSLEPELLPAPPASDDLTDYDYLLLVVYLRLLDADADGADWAEVARIVLHLDPASDPEKTRAIHAAHLARARWMRDHGHDKLLADTQELIPPRDRMH
ncbi:DUF2285 domain-containing protein [Sphingobium cloacae]|uniref:DUF2285 domain-containing protein n=1 Tax=Sphingobium cloacae TaxID=120107 RepID=A0A1E1F563_9SPHN|nr:DUF2285 domain-containing protein [Sphingobium cloacae]BAV65659.1 hypothetical protein SCLO_1026190 [Sphingobium cloacae]